MIRSAAVGSNPGALLGVLDVDRKDVAEQVVWLSSGDHQKLYIKFQGELQNLAAANPVKA